MNLQQFNSWMEAPQALDAASLSVLQDLVKEYPWCQMAELLYLMNLKNISDHRYNRQLRIAAIYAPDRGRLRRWLDGLDNPAPAEKIDVVPEQAVMPDPNPAPAETRTMDIDIASERMVDIEQKIQQSLSEIEEKRQRLRLLIEEKKALLAREKGIETEKEATALPSRALPKDELLEDFLRQQDIPARSSFFDPVEKARKSLEDDGKVISETLARLLVAQGKLSRALKIYRQLLLKNPEKSSYFAAQIENLENKLKEKS